MERIPVYLLWTTQPKKRKMVLRIALVLLIALLLTIPFWVKMARPGLKPEQAAPLTTFESEWLAVGIPEHWLRDYTVTDRGAVTLVLTPDEQRLRFMGGITIQMTPERPGGLEDARTALEETIRWDLVLEEPLWDRTMVDGIPMVLAQWTEKAGGSYAGTVEVLQQCYQGRLDGWEYRIQFTDAQGDHPLIRGATAKAVLASIRFLD